MGDPPHKQRRFHDPPPDYGGNRDFFTIKFHIFGLLRAVNGEHVYSGGSVYYWDYIDSDMMSTIEMDKMVQSFMDTSRECQHFYRARFEDGDDCLHRVANDVDCRKMLEEVRNGKIEVYILFNDVIETMQHGPHPLIRMNNFVKEHLYAEEHGSFEDGCEDEDEEDDSDYVIDNVEMENDNDYDVDDEDMVNELEKSCDKRIEMSKRKLNIMLDDVNLHEDVNLEGHVETEHLNTVVEQGGEEGEKYPEFDEEIDMRYPLFVVGLKFRNFEVFKRACRQHSIFHRCNVWFPVNDKKRAKCVCKKECGFKVWASKSNEGDAVQIKSGVFEHKCQKSFTNIHATYKWLGERYKNKIAVDPKCTIVGLQDTIRNELILQVSRSKVQRAILIAKEKVEMEENEQYKKLHEYVLELRRTNPGSTVKLWLEAGNMFEGIYICFDACKKGWYEGCRRFVGLDGAWMKGSYPGQVLSAVGIDGNDGIFPIAYAIVEKECTRTWKWFLELLDDDISMSEYRGLTIMSDRQKGLKNVMRDMFVFAEQRCCVRHMYANFRSKHNTLSLKQLVWSAAKSSHHSDFARNMQHIHEESEEAFKWLHERPFREWSRAYFSTTSSCDMLTNNLSECWNRDILEARQKSVLQCVEWIRVMLMQRMQKRRDWMRKKTGPLCPRIQAKLEENKKEGFTCIAIWSGGPKYQVQTMNGRQFVVDMEARSCSCRRWDLTGIPCGHAIRCIENQNGMPEDFVTAYYKVETYLKTYGHTINPINGSDMWPSSSDPPVVPTAYVVKRGRKQKMRRKEAEELDSQNQSQKNTKISRKGMKMTCKTCGQEGHNSRRHGNEQGSHQASQAASQDARQSVNQIYIQPSQRIPKLPVKRKTVEQ